MSCSLKNMSHYNDQESNINNKDVGKPVISQQIPRFVCIGVAPVKNRTLINVAEAMGGMRRVIEAGQHDFHFEANSDGVVMDDELNSIHENRVVRNEKVINIDWIEETKKSSFKALVEKNSVRDTLPLSNRQMNDDNKK